MKKLGIIVTLIFLIGCEEVYTPSCDATETVCYEECYTDDTCETRCYTECY